MTSNILEEMITPAESLVDFIGLRIHMDNELKFAIESMIKTEQLKSSHLLLKEGAKPRRMFFIEKGSARTFYYHDGKDVTSWMYREGQLMTSWSGFYTQTPSHENLELLEDSTIVSLSFEDLQQLYDKFSKMQEFGRSLAEDQLVFLDYFYRGFSFMTAREKYDLLISMFPEVSRRVNLGHIASFLGISRETLSRIRSV
ncbi:MAG: Crp/Fnr family transcriptional regulator [Bacteroidota bacterium]